MTKRRVAAPVLITATIGCFIGAVLFLGTATKFTIDLRDQSEHCYEFKPDAVTSDIENPLASTDVSYFPLGIDCKWHMDDGGVETIFWPGLVPTFTAYGGLLLLAAGVASFGVGLKFAKSASPELAD